MRGVHFVDSGKDPIHLTLLFDRMAGEPARLSRDAALDLLSTAGANVEVSVWLVDQKLVSLQAPTTDRRALKPAIDGATGKKAPDRRLRPSRVLAVRPPRECATTARKPLPAVHRRAHRPCARTAAAPGRKAIVYFSEGLPLAAGEESLLNTDQRCQPRRHGQSTWSTPADSQSVKRKRARAQMAMNYRLSTSRQTLNQEDGRAYTATRGFIGDRGVAVGNLDSRPIYQPSAIAQLAGKTGPS